MIDFAGACQLGFLGDLFQGIVCERQADVFGFVTGCVWWIPTKDLQKLSFGDAVAVSICKIYKLSSMFGPCVTLE